MSTTRPRRELRMKLTSHEPGMIWYFDNLDQGVIGRPTHHTQTGVIQAIEIGVIHFVSVTMTLFYSFGLVQVTNRRAFYQMTRLSAQTHRATQVGGCRTLVCRAIRINPFGDQANHRIGCAGIHFG